MLSFCIDWEIHCFLQNFELNKVPALMLGLVLSQQVLEVQCMTSLTTVSP